MTPSRPCPSVRRGVGGVEQPRESPLGPWNHVSNRRHSFRGRGENKKKEIECCVCGCGERSEPFSLPISPSSRTIGLDLFVQIAMLATPITGVGGSGAARASSAPVAMPIPNVDLSCSSFAGLLMPSLTHSLTHFIGGEGLLHQPLSRISEITRHHSGTVRFRFRFCPPPPRVAFFSLLCLA